MLFDFKAYARKLLGKGYAPLRVDLGSKACKTPGWQSVEVTPELIDRWFSRPGNIGVRLGELHSDGSCLVAIDVDLEEHALIRCVDRAIGQIVPTVRGKKGYKWFVRLDRPIGREKLHWYRDGLKRPAVDVLGTASQAVIPPSTHPETHRPYEWCAGVPLDQIPYDDLPVRSPALIDEIRGFCRSPEDPIYELNDMTWLGVGGGGDTHDRCVAAVASMVSRGWNDEDIHSRVERAKREACEAAGEAYDWDRSSKVIQEWIDSARAKFGAGTRANTDKPLHGPLADEFLTRHGDVIRFDRDCKDWYFFDGVIWKPNHEFRVRDLIGQQFLRDKHRTKGIIDGVLSSLKDRPELSITQDDWDPHPHLLNTPGGTIDLTTGSTRPHRADDFITRCTRVNPDYSSPATLWLEKLVEWFGDDPQELAYHLRLAGYFLTGETRDPCFALWHGPGGDGKSVITGIYQWLMGTYAQTATDTAFLDVRYGQHSEEIACLRGARLVLISEAGGKWNETRIKAVTGGERLSASFKFKPVFSFTPEFKPLVTTNEPPWLSSTGKDMARRLHVYPFTRPVTDPDPQLPAKLRAIAGAILAWMISGAVLYYRDGLLRSPVVEAANKEYLDEHDVIQQFLSTCVIFVEGAKTRTTTVYESYKLFCEQQGLRPVSLATLTKRLRLKGIECRPAQLKSGASPERAYFGITIPDPFNARDDY
jgi:putative DNA primase/helicase